MAKVTRNFITQGLSGKIGNVVFRVRNGQTYASAAPQKSNKKPTDHQNVIRKNFTRYAEYAKSVINNKELLAMYRAAAKNGKSAYNLAFADAAKGPTIEGVVHLCRTGYLLINARDNFKVAMVTVDVFNDSGKLVDAGYAANDSHNSWKYNIKDPNLKDARLKVVITATDFPGNSAVKVMHI